MATTIVTKNGSGAPAAGDLVQGELAVDLTNQTLYSKDSSGNVFKVGDTGGGSPGTFTDLVATDSFTSPGIDDNATSTAITIDASGLVNLSGSIEATTAYRAYDSVSAVYRNVLRYYNGNLRLETGSNGTEAITAFTASQERMRIDADGNVGIGVTGANLNEPLVVQGSIKLRGSNALWFGNTSGYLGLESTSSTNLVLKNNAANGELGFETNGSERMRIDASGTTTVTGGFEAAQPGAGTGAFAAGNRSGATSQGTYTVAIGYAAGETSQGDYSVASGFAAGQATQGSFAVALGNSAGKTTQGLNCVAIGSSAGGVTQSESAVAVGASAGYQRQGTHATAFGDKAGYTDQGSSSVAVGRDAGKTTQGDNAVACGYLAGSDTQGSNGIALGNRAGNFTQGAGSIATGYAAGRNFQGDYAVALGYEAGFGASGDPAQGQGDNAVAIGYAAGGTGQGDDSIAIGNRAGQTNQGANGIIISSGGVAINRTTANHIMLYSGSGKYMEYNGTNSWTFNGGGVTVPNDNLLVGKSSASFGSVGTEIISGGQVNVTSDTATPISLNKTAAGEMVAFYAGTVKKGLITQPASGAPSFAAASDERLKDNIVDHESELANVMSLRPTRWEWKDGSGTGEGFIAQEVEQTGWSDLVGEDVDSGFKNLAGLGTVETRLIKAMQEQQAMIETLQAEVAALKGA